MSDPSRSRRPVSGLSLVAVLTGLVVGSVSPAALGAQTPALDRGTVGAALQLRGLEGVKRVLMIAAHPDDEDTALITTLARGMGAEVAYLSLSRGDGGQNLIGPELGEGLGVIRTGELEAARALDGGTQYFTRAYDFGFSKTAEETFGHWPREEILRDAVWIVRSFRPQVIVSVFSGTPADGHGQHHAAGWAAREAFEAAGDPERFPEQLGHGVAPWRPLKLYQSRRFSPEQATLTLETGRFDPLLGRSYHQVAMESRSLHRSQDMGTGQPLGPRTTYLALLATAPDVQANADEGIFAGVDTTLAAGISSLPGEARAGVLDEVDGYREAIVAARAALSAFDPSGAVPPLARALRHLDAVIDDAGRGAVSGRAAGSAEVDARDFLLDALALRGRTAAALLTAAGVTVRLTAGAETVVPGESIDVEVELWNGGPFPVEVSETELVLPAGWRTAPFTATAAASNGDDLHVAPGEVTRRRFRVDVPADASPTRLYFLADPLDGGLFRWPDDPALHGLPWDPAAIRGRVSLSVDESPGVEAVREARYVGVDKAMGEFTRPVRVVPAVSLRAAPGSLAWPTGDSQAREISVEVEAHAPVRGVVRAAAPAGWRIEPAERELQLNAAGESVSLPFRVTPAGARAGMHPIRIEATLDDGRRYHEGFTLIDYPHIEPAPLFHPAESRITHLPVDVRPGLSVGYIQGSGDDGPDALRQMGVEVEVLGPERIRTANFDGLTTLVLGIRVYETRPEVARITRQIQDFARAGGTVVVQYNKHEYPAGEFAPYPVTMAPRASRVTDPASPVEFVDPDSPLFHSPNRITEADFEGWVQERGLYFLETWDDAFQPQLALTDPGEEPHPGSLLVAPVGEGLYVYTGLAFFRQLPAGVPGALRLFANLVSLDPVEWRSRGAGR